MLPRLLMAVWLVLALAACASPSPAAPTLFPAAVPNQVAPRSESADVLDLTPTPQVQVILVPSEIVVGPDRFAIGLIDPVKGMVHDATVHFRYFDLSNSSPAAESEADATKLDSPDHLTTIYAHEREFAREGNWGVQVEARYPDGTVIVKRISFQVISSSPTIKVGDSVPSVDTPTLAGVGGNIHNLTSSSKPNPRFYRLSLKDALNERRPTVLVFSTPGFCTSRLCGPVYDIESELEPTYQDRFNFLSVEVFSGLPNPAAADWQLTPAMKAFGLHTEPWLFLINPDGTVAYRVEGLVTKDEVSRHMESMLRPK